MLSSSRDNSLSEREESKSEERREEEKLPKKDARSPFSTSTFRALADEDNVALASYLLFSVAVK